MGGGSQRLAGSEDPVQAWHDRCDLTGAKPRKGGVLALEFVVSASRAWFDNATPEERDAWRDRSLAFVSERAGGSDNVLSAHLHDDEETPHLQILAMPLLRKERKRAGRPPKRPQERPTAEAWAFSAADIVGTPDALSQMQTDYAVGVADLGIQRGRPRWQTNAKHQSARVYRAEAAADRDAAQAVLGAASWMAQDTIRNATEDAAQIVQATISAGEKRAAAVVAKAASAAQAFSTGLAAIDAGELVHRPATPQRPEGLDAGKPAKVPVLPTEPTALQGWLKAAKPFWEPLCAYAARLGRLRSRETALDDREKALDLESAAARRVAARQTAIEAATGQPIAPGLGTAQRDAQTLSDAQRRRIIRRDDRER